MKPCRTEFQVIFEMLIAMIDRNYTISQLAQKCNLAFVPLRAKINKLLSLKLIRKFYDTESWVTTKKGKDFMELIKEFVMYK